MAYAELNICKLNKYGQHSVNEWKLDGMVV